MKRLGDRLDAWYDGLTPEDQLVVAVAPLVLLGLVVIVGTVLGSVL